MVLLTLHSAFHSGRRFIDILSDKHKQQLLTKATLLQILMNRAIAHAQLGHDENAREDFLQSLQSKAEPRHNVIDDALLSWRVCGSNQGLHLLSFSFFYQK